MSSLSPRPQIRTLAEESQELIRQQDLEKAINLEPRSDHLNLDILRPVAFKSPRSTPTLENVPKEIIYRISDFLAPEYVQNFRNFRLTCKRISRDTRSLPCRNIMFTETPESFERLRNICQQDEEIRDSVRTLTYLPSILTDQLYFMCI